MSNSQATTDTSTDDGQSPALAIVIVTYNRSADLRNTLQSLQSMQADFRRLVIINNASTDDTLSLIESFRPSFDGKLGVTTLDSNTGGAGGFHEGVKIARDLDVDWIWLSDDDALPQPGCFSTILAAAISTDNAYGSTAVAKDDADEALCWPAPVLKPGETRSRSVASYRRELPETQGVAMLPFLGMMVSRKKALEIDLPNKEYFISGDDIAYNIHLFASGAKLIQVRDSVVVHPQIPRYIVRVPGKAFFCLRMPPWRRHLDVRNRIWNSRLAGGWFPAVNTALTLLLRLLFTLFLEEGRLSQARAYLSGIFDGLFRYHRSGNRVSHLLN